MVGLRVLLLVILMGCTHTPLSELEDQLIACDIAKAVGCDLLRDEVEIRYASLMRRQERNRARTEKCPTGAKCYYGDDAAAIINSINRNRRY